MRSHVLFLIKIFISLCLMNSSFTIAYADTQVDTLTLKSIADDFTITVKKDDNDFYFEGNKTVKDSIYKGLVYDTPSNKVYDGFDKINFYMNIIDKYEGPEDGYSYEKDDFSPYTDADYYYKNFISIRTTQADTRYFNYFLRYDYSEKKHEIFLQGIYI